MGSKPVRSSAYQLALTILYLQARFRKYIEVGQTLRVDCGRICGKLNRYFCLLGWMPGREWVVDSLRDQLHALECIMFMDAFSQDLVSQIITQSP